MERQHVLATLEAVGGNKTKAAAILGIERSTLDRKMARWAKQ
jgi:Nif-specific regulatory protein